MEERAKSLEVLTSRALLIGGVAGSSLEFSSHVGIIG
jgi:hypothetical protein